MKLKEVALVLAISLGSYLIFFYKNFSTNYLIYSGSDSVRLHYQTKQYLYDSLHKGRFPFWTERMLMGYPIYADMERGILNPLNLLMVYFFGPVYSYKLLHLGFYLLGSFSLYLLLKRDGIGLLGFYLSNLIYFFSFFNIFHQQHFNIILTSYFLPLMVYALSSYYSSRSRRIYLGISFSIVFALLFYFGSFQMLLLNTVFSIVFSFFKLKVKITKKIVLQSLFIILLSFTLILPGLIPQAFLYFSSSRYEKQVFSTGSLKIPALLNITYPFLYDKGDKYSGTIASGDYFIQEVSIYTGITAVLLYFLAFIPIIKGREKVFHSAVIFSTLFLMLWGSLPLLKYFQILPFSIFRYWVRVAYIIPFIIGLGIAKTVSTFSLVDEFKFKLRDKFTSSLLAVLVTVGIIEFLYYKSEYIFTLKMFVASLFSFKIEGIVWILLAGLTITLLLKRNQLSNRFPLFLAILISFDILFYGLSASYNLFKTTNELSIKPKTPDTKAERLFDFTRGNDSDVTLVNGYWNLLGYSELTPKNTMDNLNKLGLVNQKNAEFKDTNFEPLGKLNKLRDLGVSTVAFKDGRTYKLINNMMDVSGMLNVEIEEGKIKARMNTTDALSVNTKINWYPGWALFADKKILRTIKTDSLGFITFTVPKNTKSIELVYIPIHLYYGITASLLFCFLTIIYGIKYKKELL